MYIQFIKVKDIQSQPSKCDCTQEYLEKVSFMGMHIHGSLNVKEGAMVMCPLCSEQRNLWDDGTIDIITNEQQ